ncbi:hypothetical protein JZU71_04730 [bacterium]|nr:hypothetical protein [bacterium]
MLCCQAPPVVWRLGARIGEDLCLYEVSNKSEIGKLLLKAEHKNSEKAGLRAFNKTFASEQFLAQTIWFDHKKGRKFLKPIAIKPFLPVAGFKRSLNALVKSTTLNKNEKRHAAA